MGSFSFAIQIYAALAADSEAGALALNAWVLETHDARRKLVSAFGPTEPEIDLNATAG